MPGESVPAITLTDPSNAESVPQSPLRSSGVGDGKSILPFAKSHNPSVGATRPITPILRNRKDGQSRPESASNNNNSNNNNSTWTSPVRLMRTLSSNNNTPQNGAPSTPNHHIIDASSHDAVLNSDIPERHGTPAPMDPLSEHIMKRTNALPVAHTHGRSASVDNIASREDRRRNETTEGTSGQDATPIARTETHDMATKELKKGVKAVSFLSRLIGANKKRDNDDDVVEADNSSTENRPEGNDAQVFSDPVLSTDNLEFHPQHPHPPAYIKVRSRQKKTRDFDHLFLAQELDCRPRPKLERQNSSNKLRRKISATQETNTIWAMEFSKDGKHLAAAGVDMIVRVWAVLSSSEDRQQHERQESNASEINGMDAHAQHLSAPVFVRRPVREYEGHTATILDLSWSKNNFLLSSSMDKTVRLWHLSRAECLCTFQHNDFVPSIAFHPKDDRFFLAGSLDARLRLWSIPDKSVAYSAQVGDMITAVSFTPDGKLAAAGCLSGLCVFYETDGLKYQTRTHVRSTRGANAKGSKITGIQSVYAQHGGIQFLITSNDSRVRLYNHKDQSLELKLKGNENNYSQIRATFSDDGRYVICGSEDRKAYIWSVSPGEVGDKRDRIPMEMFEANDTITTVACFAPTKTRLLLSRSEDPVYDLCNPPPVTLMSRAERAESLSSWKPDSEASSIQPTPRSMFQPAPVDSPLMRAPSLVKGSPAYQTRAAHKNGHILVTADYYGKIKVFRQDCAWNKRRIDDWDRSSIFGRHNTGHLSRNGSVGTRGSQKSSREPRTSISTEPGSARILSWRMSIGAESSKSSIVQTQDSRSISPRKSLEQRSRARRAESPAKSTKSSHPLSSNISRPTSPPVTPDMAHVDAQPSTNTLPTPQAHPSDQKPYNSLLMDESGSYEFWNTGVWKERSERMRRVHATGTVLTPVQSRDDRDANGGLTPGEKSLRPPLGGESASFVSRLSDERTDEEEDDDEDDKFDDAREEQMRCVQCHGTSFSATRTKEGTSLACSACGTAV